MSLTKKQINEIYEFFANDGLAECFINLFDYQCSLCDGIIFDNRDKIIGFRCDGEHLRAYIGISKDDTFFLKLKTVLEPVPFISSNFKEYKRLLIKNNKQFEQDIELYRLMQEESSESKSKNKKCKAQKTKSVGKKVFHKSVEKKNIVLSKLKNRQRARKFTEEEFHELADWTYCSSFNEEGYIYTLPNGNRIECDSMSEVTLLDYLVSKKLALAIGGQELCIKYNTAFRTDCDYFPDIVILTKDYHIAIIEVKTVNTMSHHLNVEKFPICQ